MKLREIALKTIYKHPLSIINWSTWCVSEQYWSYLKKYDTKQWQKVVIKVDDNIDLIKDDFKVDIIYIDVAVVNKYLDITQYINLNNIDKKKLLLELLHKCMLHLSKKYEWEKEPLLNAYQQCIGNNLEYKFKVKAKDFKSPTKEFIGYVQCYWDIDKFTAVGVISRKNGLILKQQVLLDIEPHKGEFIYYSSCKWDDAYTFSLYSKEGKKWTVAILSLV